jgi:CRP/FNR family transcriptional regulator, cyclic AMP receptor protein
MMPHLPEARGRSFVRLLEVDPDLASGMSEDEVQTATKFLIARATALPRGPWDPVADSPPQQPGSLGVLVIDGLLTRRVEVPGGCSVELVGRGDVARPWDRNVEAEHGSRKTHWEILSDTEIAWLDHEFAMLVLRWPAIVAQIVQRALQRTTELAFELAISHIVGVDLRVRQLLLHIADRWGTVTNEGVVVPVPLTNEVIGAIIGARPPSVSTALQKLTRNKMAVRRRNGTWLLDLHALSERVATPSRASALVT